MRARVFILLFIADRGWASAGSNRLSAMPGGSERLLIALRKRVRLDQLGFVNNIRLTFGLPFSDAKLAPEMVVIMHLHITFRSRAQFNSRGSSGNFVDVKAARLFRGSFPEPGPEIGRLRHIPNDGVLAIPGAKRVHKLFVIGIVQALKIFHGGIKSDQVLPSDPQNLVLGGRNSEQRLLLRSDAGRFKLFVESDVA